MVQQFLLFIPQSVGCCCCGLYWLDCGKAGQSGFTKGLDRTQLDEKLSQDVGVSTLSQNISEIVYWLILLLFLPIVLSILGLTGLLLSDPEYGQ